MPTISAPWVARRAQAICSSRCTVLTTSWGQFVTIATDWRFASASGVARGGGAMGAVAPLRFRRRKKRKIKLRVCMWSCRLSTISKVRLYKFVLYKENTGHMHQIAPLTTSKCKKLSLWEGDTPLPHPPPPPPRSLRSLAGYFYRAP